MNEKGIQPPDRAELNIFGQKYSMLSRWFRLIYNDFPKVQTFSKSFDVTSVSATSESIQTFTVNGLSTNDIVFVNKTSNTASLDVVQAWVSAANTLSIKFRNVSGGAIDPASETYLIAAIRL